MDQPAPFALCTPLDFSATSFEAFQSTAAANSACAANTSAPCLAVRIDFWAQLGCSTCGMTEHMAQLALQRCSAYATELECLDAATSPELALEPALGPSASASPVAGPSLLPTEPLTAAAGAASVLCHTDTQHLLTCACVGPMVCLFVALAVLPATPAVSFSNCNTGTHAFSLHVQRTELH